MSIEAKLTLESRKALIDAVKGAVTDSMRGSRDEQATRGSILSTLAFVRSLGFTKDEVMALVKEEWLHLTSIDNRTVKGEK